MQRPIHYGRRAVVGCVRKLFVVGALLLTVAACAGNDDADSSASAPPDAVLAEALGVVESNAYFADRIDWQEVEEEASRLRRSDPSMADVHRFVRDLLEDLGDRHSRLIVAEPSAGTRSVDLPTGHVKEGIGYLHLPAISGSDATARTAYRDAGHELLSRRACGWIVDVRLNGGGTIYPMLAAVAPLIGPGPAVTYVDRNDQELTIDITSDGGVRAPDGTVVTRSASSTDMDRADAPVAILQHFSTASAAEGVVLAFRDRPGTRTFGTETRGVPTANDGFELADGSTIALTVAVGKDDDGQRQEGPLAPDVSVPYPASRRSDLADDPVHDAARDWLLEQHACA